MRDIDIVCACDEVGNIEKATTSRHEDEEWKMYGYASTPSRDADDEQVIQKGLNLDPMLERGWVNWDHDKKDIIGVPTLGDFRPHPKTGEQPLYVEYKLLKGVASAKRVWDLAKALKDNGAGRGLGLSLEGKKRAVTAKGVIAKADIFGFAVCPYPKNTETLTSVLTKGFSNPEADDAPNEELFIPPSIADSVELIAQAIKKAISTGSVTATAKEELDPDVTYFQFPDDDEDFQHRLNFVSQDELKAITTIKRESAKRNGRLTKGEAALVFSLLGYPMKNVLSVCNLI